MADERYGYWLQDMSSTHRGPSNGGVFRLAVFIVILVIAWQWFAATDNGSAQVDRRTGVSLCEEHRGDPGWSAVCEDTKSR
jgi:hypothetical protein